MAFGGNRDRDPELVEITKTPWPAPPLNLFMMDGTRGVIDLRWDDPSYLMLNSPFQIMGVNVYRSLDSEFGPYTRITELPVGATFWRDETDNELIVDEDVSDNFLLRGSSTAGSDEKRYVLQVLHSPIVGEGSRGVPSKSPRDVRVFVDGVEARVRSVHGPTGEVELDVNYYPNVAKQNYFVPVVPTEQSRVTCTYRYTRSLLKTDLRQRIFYRVTTVGLPVGCNLANVQCTDLIETPLEYAASTNTFEIEKLDWIWKEAVRRNRWILEQGGERVKVFLQKNSGVPCSCYSDTHKQPTRDCGKCYGVGYIGGYEGPYDIIVAPDDADVSISQTEYGRTVKHQYEVWTGPQPLLSQRDFIMKVNGDRYSIGPVRMPSNRGNILQQHFSISAFDEKDIRYSVPNGDPVKYAATQFAPRGPEFGGSTEITEHDGIGDEREYRGRTTTWKNIVY
jgi:hypothetical protein